MKRKMVMFLVGASVAASVFGTQLAAYATDVETEAVTETAADQGENVETEAAAETEVETEAETEVETEAETEDDFIEGSALLTDYAYEAGELTKDGWKSEFLGLEYIPEDGISMSLDDQEKLGEYYKRHGEDRLVANSELVAKDSNGGYIQVTVEVNPNAEAAEDILGRFTELEKLELVSKVKDTEVGGLNFKTCTGIFEKEKYMIGVSTDRDDVVIAFKIKYKETESRKAILEGFHSLEVAKEIIETELVSEEAVSIDLPEEFEDAEEITETVAETETEIVE